MSLFGGILNVINAALNWLFGVVQALNQSKTNGLVTLGTYVIVLEHLLLTMPLGHRFWAPCRLLSCRCSSLIIPCPMAIHGAPERPQIPAHTLNPLPLESYALTPLRSAEA